MSHRSRPVVGRAALALAAALILALVGGCSLEPVESFDPTGPCTIDGQAEGAYPDLEALVPGTYEDRGPDLLNSGRNCTPENLGTLADSGIEELRFAGGTWDFGNDNAAVLAVFTADGLTADLLADFYAESARASSRTQLTGESEPTIAGRPGRRLDTKTGERLQTVVTWPAADDGRVNVVITHNLPDPKIDAAVAAFGES